MIDKPKLQTGPVASGSVSPSSSLRNEYVFGNTDNASEKLSPMETSPQSLHTKPWPARPQRLEKGFEEWRWLDSTIDCIMLMLPLPFFILMAFVIAVDGRAVDATQASLLDHAIKGATTLFPIFFAATTGRAAVKYATWKLEQGTTLGTLEQLMGSRTIATAFTTQYQLRSFNAIGLVLIIIWSLEPIGGQSVLHILSTPAKEVSSDTGVSYINSRQQSFSSPTGAFQNQWFAGFAVLFGSALLSTPQVKASTMDVWGNVKIPYQSSVVSSGAEKDEDGWFKIPAGNSTPIYSSLFGLPLSGLRNGNTTLNVESTYLELVCGNMSVSPQLPGPGSRTDLISTNGPFLSFENVSMDTPWAIGYQGPDVAAYNESDDTAFTYPKACPDCLPPSYITKAFEPGTLLFQEYEGMDNITSISCMPAQQYVESSIACVKTSDSQTCRVVAQRPSLLPHMSSAVTPLSFPTVAKGLSKLLPDSTPQFTAVNLIQNFIYDPSTGPSIIASETSLGANDGQTPLMSISPEEFSLRFGQLLNAYLYGSMWNATPYIVGASFDGISESFSGGNNASNIVAESSADLAAMIQNQTAAFKVPAKLVTNKEVYFVFYPWLVIFLISTMVMQLAAIIGIIFSRKTIVPDYLGYVSSLAKESPYIRMPDVGVNMDGMDKARLVKDVKVRLGDVAEEGTRGPVGRLAFARMEETSMVKKGKLYI